MMCWTTFDITISLDILYDIPVLFDSHLWADLFPCKLGSYHSPCLTWRPNRPNRPNESEQAELLFQAFSLFRYWKSYSDASHLPRPTLLGQWSGGATCLPSPPYKVIQGDTRRYKLIQGGWRYMVVKWYHSAHPKTPQVVDSWHCMAQHGKAIGSWAMDGSSSSTWASSRITKVRRPPQMIDWTLNCCKLQ